MFPSSQLRCCCWLVRNNIVDTFFRHFSCYCEADARYFFKLIQYGKSIKIDCSKLALGSSNIGNGSDRQNLQY